MPVNLFKSTFAVVLLAVDYSALHQGGLSVMVVLSARDACPGWPVCHGWWWRSLLEVPAQGGLSVMGGGGTLYARCLPRVACLSWAVAALSTRGACLVCRCLNLPVCKALVGQCIYIRCSSGLDVHAC